MATFGHYHCLSGYSKINQYSRGTNDGLKIASKFPNRLEGWDNTCANQNTLHWLVILNQIIIDILLILV